MALIVEDGTGVAGANTYVDAADCESYAIDHGLDFNDSPDGEAALLRATRWLDANYLKYWPGQRTHGRAQELQWPRTGAKDSGGFDIDEDVIPIEVVRGLCEAAAIEYAEPGSLSPQVTPGQVQKRVSVYQAIEVEYQDNLSTSVADQRLVATTVDDALASLIGRVRDVALRGETIRA